MNEEKKDKAPRRRNTTRDGRVRFPMAHVEQGVLKFGMGRLLTEAGEIICCSKLQEEQREVFTDEDTAKHWLDGQGCKPENVAKLFDPTGDSE